MKKNIIIFFSIFMALSCMLFSCKENSITQVDNVVESREVEFADVTSEIKDELIFYSMAEDYKLSEESVENDLSSFLALKMLDDKNVTEQTARSINSVVDKYDIQKVKTFKKVLPTNVVLNKNGLESRSAEVTDEINFAIYDISNQEDGSKGVAVTSDDERIGSLLCVLDNIDYTIVFGTDKNGSHYEIKIDNGYLDIGIIDTTKDLFVKYPTLEAFANASQAELEKDIHSIGFYKNKAKNIILCAKRLIEVYGGEVPRDLEELTSLAGVGRKTANVIRGNIYDDPSIVVDTHVKRISRKLGFTKEEDPEKIEYDLMKVLPKDHWILYNIQIITHGRGICTARKPDCANCFLYEHCKARG